MRLTLWLTLLAFGAGCGQKVDHPDSAPECDPATTDCSSYSPPKGGSTGGGQGEGGDSGNPVTGATITGQVVVFTDDFFDQGLAFTGLADVSAVGVGGSRIEAPYDGSAFELEQVRKDAGNWFLVEPDEGQGMLPTLTPVDTRIAKSTGYAIGMASALTVDSLFVLLGDERLPTLAQLIVTVVDDEGRSISGVQAQAAAGLVAYRQEGGWAESDLGTDDSGMIFLGNVQASSSLSKLTLVLTGAVTARVDLQTQAGAVTVATAVVDPP